MVILNGLARDTVKHAEVARVDFTALEEQPEAQVLISLWTVSRVTYTITH
jgi:hypothetical protein